MAKFVITGGKKLSGSVTVNSAKNSAVALLMASLVNQGTTRLKNMPSIEEINRLVEVLVSLGVPVKKEGADLLIDLCLAGNFILGNFLSDCHILAIVFQQ